MKKQSVPKSPTSVAAILELFGKEDIMKSFGSTFSGDSDENDGLSDGVHKFFDTAVEKDGYSFCIFSSKPIIGLIETHIPRHLWHILMDATFKTVPVGPFNQLLILHIRKSHQVYPFAFILMSKKTQAAYEAVFEYIDEHIFKLSECASFTTDYEIAMRNGCRSICPRAKLYACHFHFCQACKKRGTQTDGFVKLIRSNKQAESIYYRLMCLPLLPADYINDAFESIVTEANAIKPNIPMKKFLAYYRKQWIQKVI